MLKNKKITNTKLSKEISLINKLIKSYKESVVKLCTKKGNPTSLTFLNSIKYKIGDDYVYLMKHMNEQEVEISAIFSNMITDIVYEPTIIDGEEILVISVFI